MNTFDLRKEAEGEGGEEVYAKAVRAGRRTYFFDVKATRNDDYYLTITESRRKMDKEGNFTFDKHKLYLYKEDFQKFSDGLLDVINFVKGQKPEFFLNQPEETEAQIEEQSPVSLTSDIDEEFEKL